MTSNSGLDNASEEARAARERFREALLRSHTTRDDLAELEAAAGDFCHRLKREGVPPERALIQAKQIIQDAIDGEDRNMAERAVTSCIRHYFTE